MKQIFLTMICAVALCCSCSDDDGDKNKNYQAANFISDNLSKARQTFTLDVSSDPKELTLTNGVKLTIPGGDVFTKNNTPITGKYTVEILSMLKPSEMILAGCNTNYRGGYYLESDGFFHVKVLKDGASVDQNTLDFLTISIPTDKADGNFTQIWEGDVVDDEFAWQEPTEEAINWNLGADFGMVNAFGNNFSFSFKKLGWFNCDVFWNTGNNTTVTVSLTGRVGALASYQGYSGDTFVFFKGKGINVIAQLYTMIDNTTVQSYEDSMPIGAEGTLIAFSIKDGEYALASREITITANLQESIELLPSTKAAVMAALEALDR
ncbi:MAG: hypothetical protein LBI96_01255 [Odoribacteraceae bacterium]|jgi:hypothetical protein|nr:hypothetical protein [Odoribacteraceae bacterium]